MSLEDLSLEDRDQLALLAKQLAENPATRKQMLQLTKQVRPDMPIPELEIEETSRKHFEASNKRVEELEAKLREKEAMEALKERRSNLVRKGLAQESDIESIEKVMIEKNIPNHETAAEYWQWMQQAATPTPTGYRPSGLPNFGDAFTNFKKDPIKAARNEAQAALNDLRAPRRPIGL